MISDGYLNPIIASNFSSVQVNLAEYDKRTFPNDCKSTRNGRKCIENIVMYAEEIITHPQYENENLVNDISLIRIRGSAPYTGKLFSSTTLSFQLLTRMSPHSLQSRFKNEIQELIN